jgi:phosphoglycerate dehydrogenase-like enzyme
VTRLALERLCVHESVENVLPTEPFVAAFDDLPIPAALVGDDEQYAETDGVVSYCPHDGLLDAAWTHCARAGYDDFDTDAYASRGVPLTNSTGIHAATVGEIAGAGLDVFETEPLPADSPLWEMDEVIVSPHVASATNRYHLDIAGLVRENVERFRSGEPLWNRVA